MIRTPFLSAAFVLLIALLLAPGEATLASPPASSSCLCWEKDVLPIIKRNCLGCHNNGSAMGNLAHHDSAKAWAPKIRVQLATGKMPMRGELSAPHRATLLAWASQGAKTCP
jgi:hypothetical protein